MKLKETLELYCQELDFDMPTLDPQMKHYPLLINDTVTVLLRELPPGYALSAQIARCPPAKREELFAYLMRANFLGQGTGGARIGLDADEKFLTLSLGFPYEMNYQAFKESVEDFVNYTIYWRDEVAKHERET